MIAGGEVQDWIELREGDLRGLREIPKTDLLSALSLSVVYSSGENCQMGKYLRQRFRRNSSTRIVMTT